MEHHIPTRLQSLIFPQQSRKQRREVSTVSAGQIERRVGQNIMSRAGLSLQLSNERSGERYHVTVDVFRETKPVDALRWDDLQGRFAHQELLPLNINVGLPLANVEQLAQISVPMGLNFPMVEPTAFRNGLAMQQVGGRPTLALSVQLEYRDASQHRLDHACP